MHDKFLDLDSFSSDKMERHKYAKLNYCIVFLKIDAFGTVREYKQDQMIFLTIKQTGVSHSLKPIEHSLVNIN